MDAVTAPAVPSRACGVTPSGPARGTLAAPASKSVTNRLLVVAALASGDSVLVGPLNSDDSAAMRRAVTSLGAPVTDDGDAWLVAGTGGRLRSPGQPVDVGLSGTTMRFLTAVATLLPEGATVTGAAGLRRRPVGPLVDALRQLGASVDCDAGYPPVKAAGGGLGGGAVTVDASASSQFASAVLLVAPYAHADVTMTVTNPGAGRYIDLTSGLMREWGAVVEQRASDTWHVAAGSRYLARRCHVEADASAAAHLLAFAVATGGTVSVTNLHPETIQPDARLVDVYAAMGATVTRDASTVTVHGPERPIPVNVDLAAMPDQVTTVAALAALADGPSRIDGVGVARRHETDRLAALALELGKIGVPVDERPDGLTVHGGRAAGPARLATHDDHRLAMAFASLAARIEGLVIEEPWCVTKTYPAFWAAVARLGVDWHEVAV